MGLGKKHIDDVQVKTVDEHFRVLLECDDAIESEVSELTPDDLPDWYDDELFRKGQKYYQRNMLSMTIVGLTGVIAVLAIPSILKVLISTKQSGTACTAFKRYLSTIILIHKLYTSDAKDKNSDWWKSLNTIRWKHSTSSRRSCKGSAGPILQRDMALTQFGFIGYALLSPVELSLTNEPDAREGLNHFWRVLGHMLGINDRLNICRENEEETTKLCRLLLEEIYIKNMKKDCDDFKQMTMALIDGLWCVDVALDYQSFMSFWYGLSGLQYKQPMSVYSQLNAWYRYCLLYVLGIPYIGQLVRSGFNQYLTMNFWLAEKYPIIAIMRFGRAQTRINLWKEK